MLASPDTEQLGLRGLFLEAQREGEQEAARQFAERALKLNPKLDWPVEALFDLQCRAGDWQGALDTLAIARRQNLIDKTVANRRRAVLLTAQAQAAEDTGARQGARAGAGGASAGARPGAGRGHRRPHPGLAGQHAARRARAAQDLAARAASRSRRGLCLRTARRQPARSAEPRAPSRAASRRTTPRAPIALAITAIEAREWDEARKALEPLLEDRLTQRVCTLMARIEGEQHGHAGRVREWLARAVNAPRDPAWTADGVVSDRWAPVSPVTGALDAFRWRVPVEATTGRRPAERQGRGAGRPGRRRRAR